MKFGWSPDFGGFPVDSEVKAIAARAAQAFEEAGAHVEQYDITLDAPAATFWTLQQCANAYAGHRALYEAHADLMIPYTRHKLEAGRRVTGADYVHALGRMGQIRATFLDQFARFDLLLNPTTAVPAFPAGRPTTEIEGRTVDEFEGYNPFNFNVNMIGHPAARVPCGFTAGGLPVGLQIIGRFGDDAGVIAASAAFETVRPWAHHRPPGFQTACNLSVGRSRRGAMFGDARCAIGYCIDAAGGCRSSASERKFSMRWNVTRSLSCWLRPPCEVRETTSRSSPSIRGVA